MEEKRHQERFMFGCQGKRIALCARGQNHLLEKQNQVRQPNLHYLGLVTLVVIAIGEEQGRSLWVQDWEWDVKRARQEIQTTFNEVSLQKEEK